MNVSGMVHLVTTTIKYMLHSSIPHEIITCDDRDLFWIYNSISSLIQDTNETYKHFKRSDNSQHFQSF